MKRDWGCKKETENLLIYKLCISIFYIRTYANVIFLLSMLRRTSNTVGKVSSCSNRQEQCALYKHYDEHSHAVTHISVK